MGLFHFQDEGPGFRIGIQRAGRCKNLRAVHASAPGKSRLCRGEDSTVGRPNALGEIRSLEKFREHMFIAEVDEGGKGHSEDQRSLALKPMNCPGHVQIFRQGIKSYRDFRYVLLNLVLAIVMNHMERYTD